MTTLNNNSPEKLSKKQRRIKNLQNKEDGVGIYDWNIKRIIYKTIKYI